MHGSIPVLKELEVPEGVVETGTWPCIGAVPEEGLGGVVDEALHVQHTVNII